METKWRKRREQLLKEGMPQKQWANVLAEFREQKKKKKLIKAAMDTKAANSMAKKKKGSTG